jgi:hypothetical protein
MSRPLSRCVFVLTLLTGVGCGPISDFPNSSDNSGPISDFPTPPRGDAGVDPCACEVIVSDGGVAAADGGVQCDRDADASTVQLEKRKAHCKR